MRMAFMGSPDFSVPALMALHRAGHEIVAVYCQPARPAGRGQAMRKCPVHVVADELGLPARTPQSLRHDAAAHAEFVDLRLDVAIVAAYGLILPRAMLDAPKKGCLNIHASLLPRWRGASPIQAAILAGDTQTGITVMQMEPGLDTGPMLLRESVAITPKTTTADLHDTLADLGARLIIDALAADVTPVAQSDADATYAAKLTREDGRINWTQTADEIDRRIRAFYPWPGTFTTLQGSVLKVLEATPVDVAGPPGTVLDGALTIACGRGAIRLSKIQMPGRSVLDADSFLRGHPVPPGLLLGP